MVVGASVVRVVRMVVALVVRRVDRVVERVVETPGPHPDTPHDTCLIKCNTVDEIFPVSYPPRLLPLLDNLRNVKDDYIKTKTHFYSTYTCT